MRPLFNFLSHYYTPSTIYIPYLKFIPKVYNSLKKIDWYKKLIMENNNLRDKLIKVILKNKKNYVELERSILVTICDEFLEHLGKNVENYEKLTEEEKKNLDEIDEAAYIMEKHCDKMDKILAYYVCKRKDRKLEKMVTEMHEREKMLFYDDTDAINDDTDAINDDTNNTNRKN